MAATTRRRSAAPRIAGSDSSHAAKLDARRAPGARSPPRAPCCGGRPADTSARPRDRTLRRERASSWLTADQHGVAVAVETIPRRHGLAIRRQHAVAAAKRAHQHQQRRARQVEVRDEAVHEPELVARVDERAASRRARASTSPTARATATPARGPWWCRRQSRAGPRGGPARWRRRPPPAPRTPRGPPCDPPRARRAPA